jgi:hypothetical protein
VNELDIVRVTVSCQPTRCVAVEHTSLSRVRFAAIDICHRGTVDYHARVVFSENGIKRVALTKIELCEWNVEHWLRRVIGPTDVPIALLSCTDDVTAEETVRTDNEESHTVVFR